MSTGDLLHPQEREDAAEQVAFIMERASSWYAAHLLLFIGGLMFIPGVLAITRLAGRRSRSSEFAGRILLFIGFGAFYGVFLFEMLMGRYVADGADALAATALLQTFQSGWILGVLMAAIAAFYAGVAVVTIALVRLGGLLRWSGLAFGIGFVLILAEIITAEVLFSQVGNVVILAAGIGFALEILRSSRAD